MNENKHYIEINLQGFWNMQNYYLFVSITYFMFLQEDWND